jgi:hypothetical protein
MSTTMNEPSIETCLADQLRVLNNLFENVRNGRPMRQNRKGGIQALLESTTSDNPDPHEVYTAALAARQSSEQLDEIPRISTATVVVFLGTRMDLDLLFENLPVGAGHPILNIRMNGKTMRGVWPETKKARTGGTFLNQVTMDVNIGPPGSVKLISLKVFADGKAQMAGPKSTKDARRTIEVFLEQLHTIQSTPPTDGEVVLTLVPGAAEHLQKILDSYRGTAA